MKHATIDFETRSEVDIKAGAYKYAESPTTSILSLAYRIPGDTETQLWIPGKPDPDDLLDYVHLGGLVEAHNSFFEHCIWNFVSPWPKMPLNQWRCSMAKARACGIPGSLDLAGAALSLDIVKDKRGKYLINKLCKPRRPSKNDPSIWVDDPALLQELYDYNITDVDAEIALSNKLPSMSEQEIDVWLLDQKINERGIFIDVEAVKATLKVLEQTVGKYNNVLKELSGGAFSTGNQRDRILSWCAEQGVSMAALTKADVVETLNRKGLPQVVRDVLTLRQSLSKTSTAKYLTILRKLASDGRIHEVLQYHKAITGRWAGAGFQIQNLPRPTLDADPELLVDLLKTGHRHQVEKHFNSAFEVASSAIRSMIIAPPGKKLISADYAAIETRVLFWLGEVHEGLGALSKGDCIYCHMAAKIYRVPYEWIYDGYKAEDFRQTNMRAMGKAAVLGLGYQMGAPKFKDDCATKNIEITEAFAKQVVDTYRSEFSRVPTLWSRMEDAAISALAEPGRVTRYGRIRFKKKGNFLLCRLPSSRIMRYPFPKLEPTVTPWGADKISMTYMAFKEGRWVRVTTYGGKIVEQCCQAIARDIMAEGLLRLEKYNYPVIMSVHDEAVSEVPEDFGTVKEYCQLMCVNPSWAEGLPLKASGWEGKRYRK